MLASREDALPRRREPEVDVLRGWRVVMMITSHIGLYTRLSGLVHLHHFVTGASGFVFLAGWMLGQVSRRRIERRTRAFAYRKIAARRPSMDHICIDRAVS